MVVKQLLVGEHKNGNFLGFIQLFQQIFSNICFRDTNTLANFKFHKMLPISAMFSLFAKIKHVGIFVAILVFLHMYVVSNNFTCSIMRRYSDFLASEPVRRYLGISDTEYTALHPSTQPTPGYVSDTEYSSTQPVGYNVR